MARREYSEETKAAVMAALLAGQTIAQVASEYRIPVGTVNAWSARAHQVPVVSAVGDRRERIGDLILSNLETLMIAVEEIVKSVSADKEWLRRQSASEVAVLVGVFADKAYRILEALPEPEPPASDLVSGIHPPGES